MHAYLHINSLSFDLIIHRFISLRKISKITNKIFTLYKYSEKKLHLISMGAINRIWIKSLPIFPKFTEYSIYQKAKLNRFFDTDTTYGILCIALKTVYNSSSFSLISHPSNFFSRSEFRSFSLLLI